MAILRILANLGPTTPIEQVLGLCRESPTPSKEHTQGSKCTHLHIHTCTCMQLLWCVGVGRAGLSYTGSFPLNYSYLYRLCMQAYKGNLTSTWLAATVPAWGFACILVLLILLWVLQRTQNHLLHNNTDKTTPYHVHTCICNSAIVHM